MRCPRRTRRRSPGIDSFEGETYHTGLWPHEGVDFTGKRVGIIGTGASAVQAIPLIAAGGDRAHRLPAHANYIVPASNGPVPEEVSQAPQGRLRRDPGAPPAVELRLRADLLEKGALESTDEELDASCRPRWDEGGFGIWLGSYVDMFFVDEANAKVRNFLHDKIRETVDDPETAELLIPKGHPFGCKRNPLDTGYYETFNRRTSTSST